MVDFHQELLHTQGLEDLLHDSKHLSVGNHTVVLACNVEVALVKLPEVFAKISVKLVFFDVVIFFCKPESSTLDARVVPSVDFGNVVSLDI